MARTSVLTKGTNSAQTTAEDLNAFGTDFLSDGVVGPLTNTSGVAPSTGGLAVNAQGTPDTTTAITAGIAWITVTPTSGASQRVRAKIDAKTQSHSANTSGGTRYDWIYVKVDPDLAKDPIADMSTTSTIVVSRSTSNTTDNGTPPTYGTCIAIVELANSYTSITNGNITDKRALTGVAIGNAADGWTTIAETLTYASATTFTISGDYSTRYSKGDRFKCKQTTTKYFYITGVSYAAGTTTVTVNGGTDYTLANAAIVSPYYSKAVSPNGFPQSFAYTSTQAGFSANQTQIARFNIIGNLCTTWIIRSANGTSNATTFTQTSPVTSATVSNMNWWGVGPGTDNGSALSGLAVSKIGSNTTTINVYKDATAGATAWTGSGAKGADTVLTYQI